MPLFGQDIVVILKIVANNSSRASLTYAALGEELFMSASQVFRSVKRAETAKLLIAPEVSHLSRDKRAAGQSGTRASLETVGSGGEGGIRTHGTREGSTVFETARFNHSRTSPNPYCSGSTRCRKRDPVPPTPYGWPRPRG